MKKILLMLAIMAALGGGTLHATIANAENGYRLIAVAAEQKTVTLDVPGMFCISCPFIVSKSLRRVNGVSDVKASSSTKTAIVTYDPSLVTPDALIKATTDAGYPSTLR